MTNYNKESIKKPHRFNAVDLILLLAVATVVTILVVSAVQSSVGAQKTEVFYEIKTENIPTLIGSQFEVGQQLFSADGDTHIGEIVEVTVEPYILATYNENGDRTETPINGRVVVTLKIKTSIRENDGYLVGDIYLAVGTKINYRTSAVMLDGTCISVQKSQPAPTNETE